jgi:hypothetical protein
LFRRDGEFAHRWLPMFIRQSDAHCRLSFHRCHERPSRAATKRPRHHTDDVYARVTHMIALCRARFAVHAQAVAF